MNWYPLVEDVHNLVELKQKRYLFNDLSLLINLPILDAYGYGDDDADADDGGIWGVCCLIMYGSPP